MDVLRLSLERHAAPLIQDLSNSRRDWQQRAGSLLWAHTDAESGVGEASPLPGYSPDGLEEARRALEDVTRVKLPPPETAQDVLSLVPTLIAAELPSARFALETALLDALAQLRGKPVWRLIAEMVSLPPAQARLELSVAAVLPQGASARQSARDAVAQGAHSLKIKVGYPGQAVQEAALIRELHAELPDVGLRLDANGSLSPAGVTQLEARIAGVPIELFEEPVAPADLVTLDTQLPIALDETIQERAFDATVKDWCLEPGHCSAFVLKPMCLGGWGRCLDLWRQARRAGIRCVVSHAFGGPVERAACLHLAAVCQSDHELAAGLGLHAALASWSGHVRADWAEAPGLGVVGWGPAR